MPVFFFMFYLTGCASDAAAHRFAFDMLQG